VSTHKETNERLAQRGLQIVNAVARRRWRHYRGRIDLDELRGIGREALVWVLDNYDPNRGNFDGYARQRIGGAMADEARKRCRRRIARRPPMAASHPSDRLARPMRQLGRRDRRLRSHNSILSGSGEEWGLVLNRGDVDELAVCALPDPESSAIATHLSERVRGVVRGLPGKERAVIERLYFEGATQRAVAEELGISRHAMHRLHLKTLGEVGRRVKHLIEP
jgi:RNA polymerase sigma factor (sigma-70 family)